MITAIEIENFKGIRDRVRIELKPITLLFGPNSAGKSTILQALVYAREVIANLNLDPDRTDLGGDYVDLGGYANLVHNHDLGRPVILRFDTDRVEGRGWGWWGGQVDENIWPTHAVPQAESATVEVDVSWSIPTESPEVAEYVISLDKRFVARSRVEDGEAICAIDLDHPLLQAGSTGSSHIFPGVQRYKSLREILLLTRDDRLAEGNRFCEFHLSAQGDSPLPAWDEVIDDPIVRDSNTPELSVSYALTQIVVGPGQVVRDTLVESRYLGPLRVMPPRNYEPPRRPDPRRWARGLAAYDALSNRDDSFVEEVNDWMCRLKTGYRIRVKRFQEVEIGHASTGAAIAKLPEKRRIVLIPDARNVEVLPADVGTGVSQVLPVVVLALAADAGATVIVEQPELHLHPAIQAELGDLFIKSALGEAKNRLLIETHSEHLILRLLRRIRETTAGSLPEGFRLEVRRWRDMREGERMHPRYVLTEIGGLRIEKGLDEGAPGETTDVSLLDDGLWEARMREFDPERPAYKLVDSTQVTGKGP